MPDAKMSDAATPIAPPDADPRLRTVSAAAHIGLEPATLEAMRCRGGGPPYYKPSRTVFYLQSDLDRWLAERRVTCTAEPA